MNGTDQVIEVAAQHAQPRSITPVDAGGEALSLPFCHRLDLKSRTLFDAAPARRRSRSDQLATAYRVFSRQDSGLTVGADLPAVRHHGAM